jgi:predicted HicB family RNase H-like nuclease
MKYKGYTGVVEFDEESSSLYGRVIGLRDVITFQGESVAEVTQAFHDSVDDYLEFCAKRGRDPEKPFSGQFVLRIDPKLHRAISNAAEERRQSLNSLIESYLEEIFSNLGVTVVGEGGGGRADDLPPRGNRLPAPAKSKRPLEGGRELKAAKGPKTPGGAKGPKR